MLARGQVIGGVAQGLGECLTEEVVYDDAGQPRTGSLLDYALLSAAEIPPIVTGEVQHPRHRSTRSAPREPGRAGSSGRSRPWPTRSPTRSAGAG